MDNIDTKLSAYDQKILNFIHQLKGQRDELKQIVDQQKREKEELEAELEKIVYKLKTLDKSLSQRLTTLDNYENKIAGAEDKYFKIVQRSESLLTVVKQDLQDLENIMDKRIGTNNEED